MSYDNPFNPEYQDFNDAKCAYSEIRYLKTSKSIPIIENKSYIVLYPGEASNCRVLNPSTSPLTAEATVIDYNGAIQYEETVLTKNNEAGYMQWEESPSAYMWRILSSGVRIKHDGSSGQTRATYKACKAFVPMFASCYRYYSNPTKGLHGITFKDYQYISGWFDRIEQHTSFQSGTFSDSLEMSLETNNCHHNTSRLYPINLTGGPEATDFVSDWLTEGWFDNTWGTFGGIDTFDHHYLCTIMEIDWGTNAPNNLVIEGAHNLELCIGHLQINSRERRRAIRPGHVLERSQGAIVTPSKRPTKKRKSAPEGNSATLPTEHDQSTGNWFYDKIKPHEKDMQEDIKEGNWADTLEDAEDMVEEFTHPIKRKWDEFLESHDHKFHPGS
jgi:hypothetical protein